MDYEALTKEIIGAAYAVYNEMGFGFLESVYGSCMVVEMTSRGLFAEVQKPIEVLYRGQPVGYFVADDSRRSCNRRTQISMSIDRGPRSSAGQLLDCNRQTCRTTNQFGADGVTVRRKVRQLPAPRLQTPNPVHPVNPV